MLRNILWGAGRTVVLFSFAALAGCGVIATQYEAHEYRAELANAVTKGAKKCAETPLPKVRHAMDHRHEDASVADCYSVVIMATSRTLRDSGKEDETEKPWAPEKIAQATSATEVLGQIALPAVLSKAVYRRYLDERNRSNCEYSKNLHPINRIFGPATVKRKELTTAKDGAAVGSWESWPAGCKGIDGLFYETFVYREGDNSISQAFIVFRGTENYKGELASDWEANLALALNIEPRQFKQVRMDLKGLIADLRKKASGVRIYTAGHSLGGSMAQLAAYMSKDIEAAYTFNTSPVTGWTWLRSQKRANPDEVWIENDDPAIIRVSQDNEALGFVRLFTNAANSTVRRSRRTDIALDFPSSRQLTEKLGLFKSGLEMHSITMLACNIAARVASGSPGEFDFTKDRAETVISENTREYSEKGGTEGLCEVVQAEKRCIVDWTGSTSICKDVEAATTPSP